MNEVNIELLVMEETEVSVSESDLVFVTGLNDDVVVGRASRASNKFNSTLNYANI